MKEIVLDTETTGISIKEGHRIVEIGCIELENLIPTKKTFHCYLNPERKVSEKAFQIHGYSDEFLSKQKKFSEIVDQFLEFIKKSKNLNLETASEFLLMATWLAYLKSKLLLPEQDDDDFKALEVAEKLKLQLKKLELIRILSDQMLQKKRTRCTYFYKGNERRN